MISSKFIRQLQRQFLYIRSKQICYYHTLKCNSFSNNNNDNNNNNNDEINILSDDELTSLLSDVSEKMKNTTPKKVNNFRDKFSSNYSENISNNNNDNDNKPYPEYGSILYDDDKQTIPTFLDENGKKRDPTHGELIKSIENADKKFDSVTNEEYLYQKDAANVREILREKLKKGENIEFLSDEGYADTFMPEHSREKLYFHKNEDGTKTEIPPNTGSKSYIYRTQPNNQIIPSFKEEYDPYTSREEILDYYVELINNARNNWSNQQKEEFIKRTGVDIMSPDAINVLEKEYKEVYPEKEHFPESLEKPWDLSQEFFRRTEYPEKNPFRPKAPELPIPPSLLENQQENNQTKKKKEKEEEKQQEEISSIRQAAEKKFIYHMLFQYKLHEYADKFNSIEHFCNARRANLKFEMGIPTKARKKIRNLANQLQMRLLVHSYGISPLERANDTDPFDPRLINLFMKKLEKEAQKQQETDVAQQDEVAASA